MQLASQLCSQQMRMLTIDSYKDTHDTGAQLCTTKSTFQKQFQVMELFENSCFLRSYVHIHMYRLALLSGIADGSFTKGQHSHSLGCSSNLCLKKQEFKLRHQATKSVITKICLQHACSSCQSLGRVIAKEAQR